jgi:hypothetical protein
VFEDRVNTFIGTGTDLEGAPTRGLKPLCAIAFAQAHKAQTGAKALLRMGLGGENGFHHARRGHATALGPLDEALGRPLGIIAVRPGHVGRHRTMAAFDPQAPVTGHPLTFMEEFDDLSAEAGIELLFDQSVGHGIVVTADVHVVVNVKCSREHLTSYVALNDMWCKPNNSLLLNTHLHLARHITSPNIVGQSFILQRRPDYVQSDVQMLTHH